MDSNSLPRNPLFAGLNPLFADSPRSPLQITMAKFVSRDFELKKEEERAVDATFKRRPGEYSFGWREYIGRSFWMRAGKLGS